VIDRLSAAYLGALGNTWIRTPAFDRLAAESLVYDRATIDSPAIADLCQSLWTGRPAWNNIGGSAVDARRTIMEVCRELGTATVLLTDNDSVADHPLAAHFEEVIRIRPSHVSQQAADWQATQMAAFFAAAIELIGSKRPPALLWLHTGALARVWDSPQELRAQYSAEDDPAPPSFIEPPSLIADQNTDPDLLLGLRHAYAGEVSALDRCLEMLLDSIADSPWRDALFSVSSARGFLLGEHGVVGDAADFLYGELIRVPWIVRFPDGPAYGARSQSLVQPPDMYDMLASWVSGKEFATSATSNPSADSMSLALGGPIALNQLAIARAASGEIALTTPAWFLRVSIRSDSNPLLPATSEVPRAVDERRFELFAKPDDYFEANEVSDRCQDVIEAFGQVLQAIDTGWRSGTQPNLSLPDILIHGTDASLPQD
jgi:arylsulfatase A-like enzyme